MENRIITGKIMFTSTANNQYEDHCNKVNWLLKHNSERKTLKYQCIRKMEDIIGFLKKLVHV